ncbi:unnamed protein product [Clonostachys rosea]|uniref:Uncharacterized protein n=1 Tax=Bionectria ochroleuca TaxID=29856 RepID=A0ABY6TQ02_BIOOC|nr:unnamed protein product [Clonostachys rosea]
MRLYNIIFALASFALTANAGEVSHGQVPISLADHGNVSPKVTTSEQPVNTSQPSNIFGHDGVILQVRSQSEQDLRKLGPLEEAPFAVRRAAPKKVAPKTPPKKATPKTAPKKTSPKKSVPNAPPKKVAPPRKTAPKAAPKKAPPKVTPKTNSGKNKKSPGQNKKASGKSKSLKTNKETPAAPISCSVGGKWKRGCTGPANDDQSSAASKRKHLDSPTSDSGRSKIPAPKTKESNQESSKSNKQAGDNSTKGKGISNDTSRKSKEKGPRFGSLAHKFAQKNQNVQLSTKTGEGSSIVKGNDGNTSRDNKRQRLHSPKGDNGKSRLPAHEDKQPHQGSPQSSKQASGAGGNGRKHLHSPTSDSDRSGIPAPVAKPSRQGSPQPGTTSGDSSRKRLHSPTGDNGSSRIPVREKEKEKEEKLKFSTPPNSVRLDPDRLNQHRYTSGPRAGRIMNDNKNVMYQIMQPNPFHVDPKNLPDT